MEKGTVIVFLVFITLIPLLKKNCAYLNNDYDLIENLNSTVKEITEISENVPAEQNSSRRSNCKLIPTTAQEDARTLSRLLRAGTAFLHFHLHIENMSQLYVNEAAIEPFTVIWARKGKGYYLLTLPCDFVYLSLGTLGSDVNAMEVDVPMASDHCFRKQSDEDKERMIVGYLKNLADVALFTLEQEEKGYPKQEYKICIEKKPIREAITDARTIDTIYQCWADGTTGFVEKQWWINLLRLIGFFITAFLPVLLVNFTRKHPPLIVDNEVLVEAKTDIPLGVHHFLFHSWSDRRNFVTLRSLFYIILLTLLPYTRWFVYIALEGEVFIRRLNETFFHSFSSLDTILTVLFGVMMSLCFWICTIVFTMLTSSKERSHGCRSAIVKFIRSFWTIPKNTRTIMHQFVSKDLDRHLPSLIESSGSQLNKFGGYVLHRFQTLFYPPLWSKFFAHYGWSSIFMVTPFFISLLFYSVPFLHVPFQPLESFSPSAGDNDFNRTHQYLCHFFKFLICCSVMVYTNLMANLVIIYVIEISAFTAIGLLMNYNTTQGVFYAGIIFAVFVLKIFIRFYDVYKTRLRMFIEIAISVKRKTSSQIIDEDDIPHVPWKLFLKYIAIYKPVYVEVTKLVAVIITLTLLAMFVFHHMVITMEIADVPSVVNAIGLLLLSRIGPQLNWFTSQEETDKEDVRAEIKRFLGKLGNNEQILVYLKAEDCFNPDDAILDKDEMDKIESSQQLSRPMVLRSGRTF